MKRFAWLAVAAFCTLLAQVQPVEPLAQPVAQMSCCTAADSCAHHRAPDCGHMPAKECALCVACGLNCHLAVPTGARLPQLALIPVERLESSVKKGLVRNEPPPLPPPRGLA